VFNVRDDRETPLLIERGMRAGGINFGKTESGIFSVTGLDRWNRVEAASKISFSAHVIFVRREASSCAASVKIEIDLPVGSAPHIFAVVATPSPPSWPGIVPAIHVFRQTS